MKDGYKRLSRLVVEVKGNLLEIYFENPASLDLRNLQNLITSLNKLKVEEDGRKKM